MHGSSPSRILQPIPMRFAGINRSYTFAEMASIPLQWNDFGAYLGTIVGQVSGMAYGVVHSSHADGFEYASAVEVGPGVEIQPPLTEIQLPAYSYVEFDFHGHVSELSNAIGVIWREWLPKSKYRPIGFGVMLECYGDGFDPRTGSGDIQLRFAVEEVQ